MKETNMRGLMVVLGLCGALAGCTGELDEAVPTAETSLAVTGRGYCSGSGNPPIRQEPKSTRFVQTKWCDNMRAFGRNGAELHAGTNWAVCQKHFDAGWYVWTLGDSGGWDWFHASQFSGGEDNRFPIGGLVNCSVYF